MQFLSLYYNKTFTKKEIDALFEPITSKYGIKIIFEVGDDFFSPLTNPPIPAGPNRKSTVVPIRHRLLSKYPQVLMTALDKYPVRVITNSLNAIHFAGEIDQFGFKYGGSYDPFRRIIFLVNDGGQTDDLAESVFHHEFSSILLNRHTFFINPWEAVNPKEFKYLYETYGNFKNLPNSIALNGKGSEEDYMDGFLDDYSRTDFENDYNAYSAMIFTYPEKFKKIMNQYPRVRKKFLIWLEFYQKIDPIFTEKYLFGNNE